MKAQSSFILVRVTDISFTSSCRWTAWCCSCTASESSWKRQTASGWMSCFSCSGTASCCRRASLPWPVCCCWRSWSSELEAGCSAAPRTSTTTVKLLTRIVARTKALSSCFTGVPADIQAPWTPVLCHHWLQSQQHPPGKQQRFFFFLKSAAHKL